MLDYQYVVDYVSRYGRKDINVTLIYIKHEISIKGTQKVWREILNIQVDSNIVLFGVCGVGGVRVGLVGVVVFGVVGVAVGVVGAVVVGVVGAVVGVGGVGVSGVGVGGVVGAVVVGVVGGVVGGVVSVVVGVVGCWLLVVLFELLVL